MTLRPALILATLAVLSLLLARVHPFGDAGLEHPSSAPPPLASVPAPVRAILQNKCADCHSNAPRLRFYGRFAPISWLLERDILQGRRALNLSQWDTYPADQQQSLASQIAAQTRTQRMPLRQYRLIHPSARVTPAEVATLTVWAHTSFVPEPVLTTSKAPPPPLPTTTPHTSAAVSTKSHAATSPTQLTPDATRGATLFARRCAGCHSLDEDKEGPRLRGLLTRASGDVPSFAYSSALKAAHIRWTQTTLDRWLADPQALVPDTDMDLRVPDPQDRQDLIRFLANPPQP